MKTCSAQCSTVCMHGIEKLDEESFFGLTHVEYMLHTLKKHLLLESPFLACFFVFFRSLVVDRSAAPC